MQQAVLTAFTNGLMLNLEIREKMKRIFAYMYKLASTHEDEAFSLFQTSLVYFVLVWINILVVIIFISRLFHLETFIFHSNINDTTIVVTLVIAAVYVYFTFLHKKKYKQIITKYTASYLVCILSFWLYLAITVTSAILVALFRHGQ